MKTIRRRAGIVLAILVWLTRTSGGFADDAVIGRVDFDGNRAYSASELRRVVNLEKGTILSQENLDSGQTRLLEFYRQAGFLFAESNVRADAAGDSARVVFAVREGRRARLRAFEVVGAAGLSETAIRRLMDARENAPFDAAAWERGVARTLDEYANRGHPFAAITTTIAETRRDEGLFDLRLIVEERERVSIERVEFEGLAKTRLTVARRLVPIREGDAYDRRRVEETRHRLVNSAFFAQVHPSLIQRGSAPDRVVLRARVVEARTGRIAGIIGYAPPANDADAPQLTGLVEAVETSLAGTGREVAFKWESGEARSAHFHYREPYLVDMPISASIGWSAERHEAALRETGFARLDWQANPYWSVGVGTQFVRADASEGWGILVESIYDRRDYKPNPSTGWSLRTRVDFVRGGLSATRYETEFEAVRRLWGTHVIAARLNESRIRGRNLPASERVTLGGASTLRGYRERAFHGASRLFGGVEYRILTGPDSRVFAFLDAGAVDDETTSAPLNIGYGVGASLESRGGVLRLDYGLAPGTPPLRGMVHIRLGAAF